jgi:hypothetical protein
MPDDPLRKTAEGLSHAMASSTTRKSFIARVAAAVFGLVGLPLLVATGVESSDSSPIPGTNPTESWYGFCGHYWTTGACPGPHAAPRVDAAGFPVDVNTGTPIDNLGRPVNASGQPIGADGTVLLAPDGRPLSPAPRTRLCENWAVERYGLNAAVQGSWYRCCDGMVRRLSDCCSTRRTRINGDAALQGYCQSGRTVFCFVYSETGVPC